MVNLGNYLSTPILAMFLTVLGCAEAKQPRNGSPTIGTKKTNVNNAAPSMLRDAKSVGAGVPKVTLLRAPNGGIQPQAIIDEVGSIHLIYFKGDPAAGDLYYVRKGPRAQAFSDPLRVNRNPGSVVAIGNVRGAHLAAGRNGWLHVAWMGSQKVKSRETQNESPMLYTRLTDKGDGFEPERNVIRSAYGLDGGGSVAADDMGNVYVVWHAPAPGKEGERNRKVWVAHSKDDGKSFAREESTFDQETGACGCCGMRAFADPQGAFHVLFRSATKQTDRDVYLLSSPAPDKSFTGIKLHAWSIGSCPMSTMSFGADRQDVVAAWETKEQVYFARIDTITGKPSKPIAAPGQGRKRKHPVVAVNSRGDVLLAWTEGMGWKRGGNLAWQVFDKNGKPTEAKGQARGVPAWSVITAVALKNGGFVIVR